MSANVSFDEKSSLYFIVLPVGVFFQFVSNLEEIHYFERNKIAQNGSLTKIHKFSVSNSLFCEFHLCETSSLEFVRRIDFECLRNFVGKVGGDGVTNFREFLSREVRGLIVLQSQKIVRIKLNLALLQALLSHAILLQIRRFPEKFKKQKYKYNKPFCEFSKPCIFL